MSKVEEALLQLTPNQAKWAEMFNATGNGMGSVRLVWPNTKNNPGYQNTRAWKLKNNPRIKAYLALLKKAS
jgi:hypothetical protein